MLYTSGMAAQNSHLSKNRNIMGYPRLLLILLALRPLGNMKPFFTRSLISSTSLFIQLLNPNCFICQFFISCIVRHPLRLVLLCCIKFRTDMYIPKTLFFPLHWRPLFTSKASLKRKKG